jgi:predicted CopG family antitoxin
MYRHRQLHLWITDHDYSLLRELAEERKESLSAVIRRLIKLQHAQLGEAAPLDPVPPEAQLSL